MPLMCRNLIIYVICSWIFLHAWSKSVWAANGSIDFLLCSLSKTNQSSHATVSIPAIDISFMRYHTVSNMLYTLAASLQKELWSLGCLGVSMEPSIQSSDWLLSIIQAHEPHWFWNELLDTARAVPDAIASHIFWLTNYSIGRASTLSPLWFVPFGWSMLPVPLVEPAHFSQCP